VPQASVQEFEKVSLALRFPDDLSPGSLQMMLDNAVPQEFVYPALKSVWKHLMARQ
jgi:hypothetical protein